jgi:hypothetical protein
MFERICVEGQQRGDVRSDLTAARLGAMLESMCLGAIMLWLATPSADLKQEFAAVQRLALSAVSPQ